MDARQPVVVHKRRTTDDWLTKSPGPRGGFASSGHHSSPPWSSPSPPFIAPVIVGVVIVVQDLSPALGRSGANFDEHLTAAEHRDGDRERKGCGGMRGGAAKGGMMVIGMDIGIQVGGEGGGEFL
jgi:hypothetical protein